MSWGRLASRTRDCHSPRVCGSPGVTARWGLPTWEPSNQGDHVPGKAFGGGRGDCGLWEAPNIWSWAKASAVVPMVSFLPTTIFIVVDRNIVHLLLLLQRWKSPSKHSPERSLSCFFCCSISKETVQPLQLKKHPHMCQQFPSLAPCNKSNQQK